MVDRFLAGVLLEDDGSTADRYALLLAWMFARGVPALPAAGMQALPEQLAAPLGDRVRLGHRVERVAGTRVVAADRTWTARQVVVATDGPRAPRPGRLAAPATKGVVTDLVVGAGRPGHRPAARRRPAGTAAVRSSTPRSSPAPRRRTPPPGATSSQGSALLGPGRAPDEAAMRRHAGDLLGVDASRWEVVARHEVPDALPAQPAPYDATRPVRVGDLVVCGDHRDTGSIQGALVSGQRAAAAVLRAVR